MGSIHLLSVNGQYTGEKSNHDLSNYIVDLKKILMKNFTIIGVNMINILIFF